MKRNVSISCAALTLAISIGLQGCELPWNSDSNNGKTGAALEVDAEKTIDKEATAQCKDGKFSCSGLKEWCGEQMKRCNGDSCDAKCTWKCQSQKCDQVCAPKCDSPICSTRCKGFNTESCKMKCGQPNCVVVCPKFMCPGQNCPKCKTKCGEPVCSMDCGEDEQPCRHVCAEPRCNWQCSKPTDCPKPKCKMECDKPRSCIGENLLKQLPPLQPGETEVEYAQAASAAPQAAGSAPAAAPPPGAAPAAALVRIASALDGKIATMRVNITTMAKDRSLQEREVDLPVASPVALGAVQVGSVWTTKIRQRSHANGRVTQSEASCDNGHFQCQGDTIWCAEQAKSICVTGHHMFLQQRWRAQRHTLA